jgi:hypothetical protein
VQTTLEGIEEKLHRLCELVPRTASEAAEQFRLLFYYLGSSRRDAPTTYSLLPDRKWGIFHKLKATEPLRLTLWCENPGRVHPVVPIGSGESGDYLIKVPREWLVNWAPYIKWILTALRAAVPVGGALLRASMEDTVFKNIDKRLAVAESIIGALPPAPMVMEDVEVGEWSLHRSLDEPELREFHRMIAMHINDRKWGSLVFSELPDKTWRWLCPRCRAQLSPSLMSSLGQT